MIRREGQSSGGAARGTSVPSFLDRARETREKLELRGGRIFVTSRGSRAHDAIRTRVAGTLRRQLEGRPWRVLESEPVQLDLHNVLRPDVAIVFDGPDRTRLAADPVVVVEVLEPATAEVDRGERGLHYRGIESLEHYVLIASDAQRVELFTREHGQAWSYRTYDGMHRMVPIAALDLTLLLASVFEGVELAGGSSGPRP